MKQLRRVLVLGWCGLAYALCFYAWRGYLADLMGRVLDLERWMRWLEKF